MIVNPGIRRFLGSAIQRLFNSASFYAPLTHTAVPQRAATGTTATFTRATTKTVENNDGYLVTLLAGEIGFPGTRRVDNLIRLGAAQSSTLAIAANVTMTLPAGAYQFSMGAGTGTATFSGTGGATGTLAASASGRVFVAKTITAGTLIVTGSAAILNDIQVVSMVAETDQTTIREYVSVGVESAPYYHGSFVDGVKCFPTDLSGNPLTTMLGYSAEGARTNLCLQSQTIATAPWQIGNGISVTADQYVAPDGTTTVDKLTALAGNTQHFWYQQLTTTAAVHTYSVHLRYVNNQWARIGVYDRVGSFYAAFDILNGVVGSTLGAVTATAIEPMGDGVTWRVSLTATLAASAMSEVYLSVVNADDPSFGLWNAAGTEAIGAWGAQLNLGSFASSYIATTTVAVTRNADVESYSTSGNIAAAAGSVYLEYTPTHAPSGTVAFWGTYVDADNYTAILHDATNLIFRKRIAGSNYDATIANAFVSGTTYKVAATWGAAGTAIYLDGVAGTPHANTTAAQIAATMQVGADGNSLQQPGAGTTNLRIWQRQLSSPEGVAVTA